MAHISLITLGVDDVERAARFHEALGWRRSTASQAEVAFLVGGTVVLGLFGREDLAADAGTSTTSALAVNLDTVEEVDELLAAAAGAGGEMVKPAEHTDWGGYSGYFADVDGHLWEVAHNPHFPLDEDGRIYPPVEHDPSEAEAAEASISAFIERADDLDGPSVAELATDVEGIVATAWEAIATRLDGVTNDKVLATMLAFSQGSRRIDSSQPAYWQRSAASTLVSGMIPNAQP